jgi:large subunit ribosomal protein L17
MRHGKKDNHLGRKKAHRESMLSNMASSLFLHKRITTTVAKAKELRKYVEPLITKAKTDSMHSRRTVFSYLQNKESIKALFGEVATRTAERPGGYTRIIKIGGVRLGDIPTSLKRGTRRVRPVEAVEAKRRQAKKQLLRRQRKSQKQRKSPRPRPKRKMKRRVPTRKRSSGT